MSTISRVKVFMLSQGQGGAQEVRGSKVHLNPSPMGAADVACLRNSTDALTAGGAAMLAVNADVPVYTIFARFESSSLSSI